MRDRLGRPRALLVALAVLFGLCGCTTIVQGQGRVASSSASRSIPSSSTPSPSATSTPTALRRIVHSTSIGDPGIADICAAVGSDTWSPLNVTAEAFLRQFPPGCDLSLSTDAGPQIEIAAFVEPAGVASTTGGVARRDSGQRVLAFPYVASSQQCERLLTGSGFEIQVRTYSVDGVSASTGRRYACRATDAMVRALATGVSYHVVSPLVLASPSITRFDACKVAISADFESLPLLAGATIDNDSFGLGCEFDTDPMYLTVQTALEDELATGVYRTVTVGRHRLFTTVDPTPKRCLFLSRQGLAPDGRYEFVEASAHAVGSTLPAAACATTQQALTRYLDTAGLT